jgi:hypothetical protein
VTRRWSGVRFAERIEEGGDGSGRVVAPHGDVVRPRWFDGSLVEEIRERPSLGSDELVGVETQLFGDDELEQEGVADVADVFDGRDEPVAKVRAAAGGGAVHGARRTGAAGLGASGFDQSEGFESFEGAVDELARQVPDVTDGRAGPERSGDVVAVARLLDENPQDGPLIERQGRAPFHAPEVATTARPGCC